MHVPAAAIEFGELRLVPPEDDPQLELVQVLAAVIEPRLGGQLMKGLGAAAPLGALQHVKRVRKSATHPGKLEVVLCPAGAAAAAMGSSGGGENGSATGVTANGNSSGGAGSGAAAIAASLPEAVAAIVKEHGLEVFAAQVGATE